MLYICVQGMGQDSSGPRTATAKIYSTSLLCPRHFALPFNAMKTVILKWMGSLPRRWDEVPEVLGNFNSRTNHATIALITMMTMAIILTTTTTVITMIVTMIIMVMMVVIMIIRSTEDVLSIICLNTFHINNSEICHYTWKCHDLSSAERRVMRQILWQTCEAGKLDKALITSLFYCYVPFIPPTSPLLPFFTSLLNISSFSFLNFYFVSICKFRYLLFFLYLSFINVFPSFHFLSCCSPLPSNVLISLSTTLNSLKKNWCWDYVLNSVKNWIQPAYFVEN